ncbi:MAG TPA: hypothetical protein VFG46_03270 [Chryseolinea sp.]|nr:hypothetical protein [Chryseolinea sp.]
MKQSLSVLNRVVLLMCISMYFGTGWSLVLFSFPIAPELTPDNYYNQFVPQVTAATKFFTYMTMLMMVSCAIFIIEEWKTSLKWYPIIILALIIAATLLTTQFILPYNKQMANGIKDPAELQTILSSWMNLNIIRVLLWTLQWITIVIFFATRYSKFKTMQHEKVS